MRDAAAPATQQALATLVSLLDTGSPATRFRAAQLVLKAAGGAGGNLSKDRQTARERAAGPLWWTVAAPPQLWARLSRGDLDRLWRLVEAQHLGDLELAQGAGPGGRWRGDIERCEADLARHRERHAAWSAEPWPERPDVLPDDDGLRALGYSVGAVLQVIRWRVHDVADRPPPSAPA